MLTQCTYEPPRNIVKIQIPGPQLEILIQQFFKEEAKICVFNQLLREFIKRKTKPLEKCYPDFCNKSEPLHFLGTSGCAGKVEGTQ